MNRLHLIRLSAAAGTAALLGTPRSAYAQLFGASIVYDPSNYAAMLKSLANQFVHNKNELMLINLALNQWQALQWEHKLSIGQIWQDVSPLITKFHQQLLANDKISQSTKDVYTAVTDAFPAFNPSAPVPYLLDVYRRYMQMTAANIIAATKIQQQTIQDRGAQLTAIQKRAAVAQSQYDQFQSASEMSAHTAQGIDLLHSTLAGFVRDYGVYLASKAAAEQASQSSGRLLIARQLLGSAQGTFTANPPVHTAAQYTSNPSLLPKIPDSPQ